MPAGKKPTLLAQGKPRTMGGGQRPWRVRLYAPRPGGTSYQVIFKAPAGDGQPWRRVLRRANSEGEAGEIFGQAEAALDAEGETPASADVRASRTIRALRYAYLDDSRQRNKHPRTGIVAGAQSTHKCSMNSAWRPGRTSRSAPIPARAVSPAAGVCVPQNGTALSRRTACHCTLMPLMAIMTNARVHAKAAPVIPRRVRGQSHAIGA